MKNGVGKKFGPPAIGDIDVYDGLTYRGRISQRAGKWSAFDAHDKRIGIYSTERQATAAIYRDRQQVAS